MIQLIGLASEEIIIALRRLPRHLGWGRLHSFIRFVGGIFPRGLTPDRSFFMGCGGVAVYGRGEQSGQGSGQYVAT